MDEKKILVIYIGVAGVRTEDIGDYVHTIQKRITPTLFEGELILIPIQSYDTRIECINPKYITNKKLVQEHTELIEKLNNELTYQLDEIKKGNDVEKNSEHS